MSSTYGNLWLAAESVITTAHAGTPFAINGLACTIRRTKTAVARELLEVLPVIGVVIGERPGSSEPFSTGNEQLDGYLIQLVVIAASNRDQVAGGEDVLEARERLMKLFRRPALLRAQVSQVLRTEVLSDAPISRAAFLAGYDFSSLAVRAFCVVSAT